MAEQFVTNSRTFPTPGYARILNIDVLNSGPGEKGGNRDIPHVDGQVQYPHRADQKTVTLELYIEGLVTHAGVAHTSPGRVGKQLNEDDIKANVTTVGTGLAYRSATYTKADGSTVTANVQFGPLELGQPVGPDAIYAAMDVTLPADWF